MKTKGSFKKGCVPWNKGLTKETDERIKRYSRILIGVQKSKQHKRKISQSKTGRKLTLNEYIQILEAGKIGRSKIILFRKGKTWEEIYGLEKATRLRNVMKKVIPWNKGLRMWVNKNHPKGMKGKAHSKETKRKLRELTIEKVNEQYKKTGIKFPRIGKNETRILDSLEKKLGIDIKRQYQILGYIVDGYCEKINCVFEIYEKRHYIKKNIVYDRKRKADIQEELKCDFVIIDDIL